MIEYILVISVIHIVICDNKENELEKLINKERRILLRGSATRRIPHSRIFINDELYFVKKGSNVSKYCAKVKNADSLSKLTNDDIESIFEKYKEQLNLSKNEEKKWKKKCLCIIEFDEVKEIEEIDIPNYTNLEDWIMVNSLEELKLR